MSGPSGTSKSRRRPLNDSEPDETFPNKRSLVDYSKITDRHVDDARYEKQRQQGAATSSSPSSMVAAPSAKMSSQMQAVVRLMTGKEERTIAEKIADSNRPTWDQYKKDNQDKFEFAGLDKKKMEEYRRELDKEREKILSRGVNRASKKKESSDGSESSESEDTRSKKKNKHKHKREIRHHDKRGSSRKRISKHKKRKKYDSSSADDSDRERRKRKKSNSRRKSDDGKNEGKGSADDAYRLSSFFAKDSSSGSSS
jgi:hypothetical protein